MYTKEKKKGFPFHYIKLLLCSHNNRYLMMESFVFFFIYDPRAEFAVGDLISFSLRIKIHKQTYDFIRCK